MKRVWPLTALILLLLGLVMPRSTAREIVEIRLRGHYYPAPATVLITVAVEPAADHTALLIEADSDQYFRSSAIALEGANERRVHSIEFKSLPAGRYQLSARVMSKGEVLATATEGLIVLANGEDR